MRASRHAWTAFAAVVVCLAAAASPSSCGSDSVRCGAGTRLVDGACVGASPNDGTPSGTGAAATGAGGSSGAGGTAGRGAGGPVDPGYPEFPSTIDALSIAIRTGYGGFDGTDANDLELCLTESKCFTLDVTDVDDFRVGEIDVYHFYGVGLPRADVDRVEIRSTNGTDAWTPACVEVRFDGEPVHCEDAIGATFGSAAGELASWKDPAGLHEACVTCYPSTLTHGPLVGATGPDHARVRVRTDATRKVGLHLVDPEDPASAPVVAWQYPSPTSDFTTVFDVDGLAPQTEYSFFFEVDGEIAAALGKLRTGPPAGGAVDLRLAFGSCTKLDPQPIFAQIQAKQPDLFFFIGDNHYGNTPNLGGLRWNYRWSLERPQRAALLMDTPTLATWDDHDFVGNNTNGTAPGKDVALRVFQEYWANWSYGTAQVSGVFSKFSWGDVDFFLLDDRYHRSLVGTVGGSILGPEQTSWLETELAASTATFKLLLSGSQYTLFGNESWKHFPEAREALFDFLRDQKIDGVVLLSGDVHRSEFRSIARAADGGYDLPELTSSPLANLPSACKGDAEELDCFDAGDYFVLIDIDTTRADPTLVATIFGAAGKALTTWTIQRSSLMTP